MLNSIHASVLILVRLAFVIVFSPLLGCVGLITAPLRLWQVVTGRLWTSALRLASPAKKSALAGIAFVLVAMIGWLAVIVEIFQAVTCSSAGCALASLEVFLILCLFGCVYGVTELLLIPITFPRLFDTRGNPAMQSDIAQESAQGQ